MITTASYIPGVMTLHRTLKRFSSHPLVVYTTTELDLPAEIVQLNIFEVTRGFRGEQGGEDPDHEFHPTDLSPTSFVDAPRRLLFLLPIPIVFLDADLLIVSKSIDALIELCAGEESCYAVGNFRNKKGTFNDPPHAMAAASAGAASANFNSGVMVVPYDGDRFKRLYTESCRMLRDGYNDTEEKLLNVLFEGAWQGLPVGYNLQKRCFARNPPLWNSVLDGGNGYSSRAIECAMSPALCVVHYVGGKPWQSLEELRVLDYEEDGDGTVERLYGVLFEAWRSEAAEVPRAALP
jgi:hypothetical protein